MKTMTFIFTFVLMASSLSPLVSFGQDLGQDLGQEAGQFSCHQQIYSGHNPLKRLRLPDVLEEQADLPLIKRTRPNYPTTMLDKYYELEREDLQHRYGLELYKAWKRFQSLYPSNIRDFWSWLDKEGHGKKIVKVRYLLPHEKASYRYKFKDNQAINPHVSQAPRNIQLMFVMDETGSFYMRKKDRGEKSGLAFHHSSFTAGGPVASAGMMVFDHHGSLVEVNDLSGHYRPTDREIFSALDSLKAQGVDLSQVRIRAQNLKQFKTKHGIPREKEVSAYYWWYQQRKTFL